MPRQLHLAIRWGVPVRLPPFAGEQASSLVTEVAWRHGATEGHLRPAPLPPNKPLTVTCHWDPLQTVQQLATPAIKNVQLLLRSALCCHRRQPPASPHKVHKAQAQSAAPYTAIQAELPAGPACL